MSEQDKQFAMDRILARLREFDAKLKSHVEALEVCYHRGKISKEIFDEAEILKREIADLITLASDWRGIAGMNGVDLND